MTRVPAMALCLPLLLPAGSRAQEKAGSGPQEKAEAPKERKTGPPLKVQLLLSKYQGDKKVGSLPYAFIVSVDDPRPTRVRVGVEVPLGTTKEGRTEYRTVGTSVDCTARSIENDRFELNLSIQQSAVYSPEGDKDRSAAPPGAPFLRSFYSSTNLLLRDGQSAQYAVATDPITGDVWKVDLTSSVLK